MTGDPPEGMDGKKWAELNSQSMEVFCTAAAIFLGVTELNQKQKIALYRRWVAIKDSGESGNAYFLAANAMMERHESLAKNSHLAMGLAIGALLVALIITASGFGACAWNNGYDAGISESRIYENTLQTHFSDALDDYRERVGNWHPKSDESAQESVLRVITHCRNLCTNVPAPFPPKDYSTAPRALLKGWAGLSVAVVGSLVAVFIAGYVWGRNHVPH
jgi:hypothetical protein